MWRVVEAALDYMYATEGIYGFYIIIMYGVYTLADEFRKHWIKATLTRSIKK